MKRNKRLVCACLLTFSFLLALTACGKKKKTSKTNDKTTQSIATNSRTTTNATTQEKEYTLNVKTIDNVTYNIYSVVDGVKTLDSNNKKYKENDKVILEIINRTSKNLELFNETDKVLDVKNNIKCQTEEITITNNLSFEVKESEYVFIDFNPYEIDGISFEATYTDNGASVTKTDDFFVKRNTKVYFYVVNDSYNVKEGYIQEGTSVISHVGAVAIDPHTDPAQNPVKTCFDDEGLVVTNNLSLGYVSSYGSLESECKVNTNDVTVTFTNKTTNDNLELNNEVHINQFDRVEVSISNPTKKDLVISAFRYGECNYYERTKTEEITLTFDLAKSMSFYVEDYKEFDFVFQGAEGVDAYFYYIDKDGIETELKSGDKCPLACTIGYEITNNTKYNATISIFDDLSKAETDWEVSVLAKASFSSKDSWESVVVENDNKIIITLADVESKLYKVKIDDRCKTEGVTARLGYYRGMYDYPEADINKEFAESTWLAAVFSNGTDYNVEMEIINTDTGEILESETIYGYGKDHPYNCASGFQITCNVTIILYPIGVQNTPLA